MSKKLTHFSLFTGIGGIDFAAEWAGFDTIGQVEKTEYCQKVLTKHWPDVPGWSDIENLYWFAGDCEQGPGNRPYCPRHDEFYSDCACIGPHQFSEEVDVDKITLITGGEPCQPHSISGDGEGEDDERYLWDEMLRIVKRLRPRWVLNENVQGSDGHTGVVDQKSIDLENAGYKVFPVLEVEAGCFGGVQRRGRIFILAYREGIELQGGTKRSLPGKRKIQEHVDASSYKKLRGSTDLPEKKLRRSRAGISDYVDRIKALGNAVVPQQVYPILESIAQIEQKVEC